MRSIGICLFILLVGIVGAYPDILPVTDTVFTEGDYITFEVHGYSWQRNALTFDFDGGPDGMGIYQIGHVGGCFCSRTEWAAACTLHTDYESAGEWEVSLFAIDTLGSYDSLVITLIIENLPFPPEFLGLVSLRFQEGDTVIKPYDEFVFDFDHELEDLEFAAIDSGVFNIEFTETSLNISTIDPDLFGIDTITITVTDPDVMSDTLVLPITVLNRNDPPVLLPIPADTIAQFDTLEIDLDDYATDIDNPIEELRWTASDYHMIDLHLDDSTHIVTIADRGDFIGTQTIRFRATDPGHLADNTTLELTVLPDNSPPVIDSVLVFEMANGSEMNINLGEMIHDSDHDLADIDVCFTGAELVSITRLDAITAHIIALPDADGIDTIDVIATDPSMASDTGMIIVTVSDTSSAIHEETRPSNKHISILPNPFNSSVLIEAGDYEHIEIFDTNGRTVYCQKIDQGIIEWIPDNSIESGLFIIKLRDSSSVNIRRVVYIK